MACTANEVVNYAKKFVSNKPYYSPNTFTRWYGFGGQVVPWCAVFVYYCLAQVGGKEYMTGCANKAYCPTIWNWGKAKKYNVDRWGKIQAGDLVLFDWEQDNVCDHIGFVIKDLGNGYVQTVEGNTSSDNDSNGNKVQIRTRHRKYIKGFLRLPYKKAVVTASKPHAKKSVQTIAQEVIDGKWGNGNVRVSKLKAAGYNPSVVQAEVNKLMARKSSAYTVQVIAKLGLNMRSGAGTTYPVLTTLKYKTKITITSTSNGWGKTTYGNKTGWVYLSYTKKC